MPDTTGVATPDHVAARVRALKERYPTVDLECHFHNDRGFALVNAMTAVQAGAQYMDTSIWGLAERSGIPSVTGFLLNLFAMDPVYTKGYQLNLCYPLNVRMGSILNTQVPITEPVSLTNRTHTAGVHQKAVINHAKTYEAHHLERFGVTEHQMLLGPLSGWNSIFYYLKEVCGYTLSRYQAMDIAKVYKREVTRMNKETQPEALLQKIVQTYPLVRVAIPKEYQERRIENLAEHS